jgi:hypothetical protein
VVARVLAQLETFLNCLAAKEKTDPADELMGSDWEGWPFGRNLYVAEILSLIQRVPGVKHVLEVHLKQRPVMPEEEASRSGESDEEALTPVSQNRITVPADTLLCSLEHKVTLAELEDEL